MILRKRIRYMAIILLLAYTVVRFFIVRSVLEGYGVNAWIFLAIDSVTAIIYVIGIEHLIVSIVHKGQREGTWVRLLGWALLTAISFAAPYAYIYSASRKLPTSLGIGLGVIIAILSLNAVVAFARRIRRLKGE
jgi:hypothetical protein